MTDVDDKFRCDGCGVLMTPGVPPQPLVPYLFVGGILGERHWHACSDACMENVTVKIQAMIKEQIKP